MCFNIWLLQAKHILMELQEFWWWCNNFCGLLGRFEGASAKVLTHLYTDSDDGK